MHGTEVARKLLLYIILCFFPHAEEGAAYGSQQSAITVGR